MIPQLHHHSNMPNHNDPPGHSDKPVPAVAMPTPLPDRRRLLLPLVGLGLALGLASCFGGTSSVPVVDTEPIGSGLRLIGYALLGLAVVTVLGKLIR